MQRLRALVMDNFNMKVLSLLLALLIYLVVQRDSVREASIDVPLGVANVPSDLIFVGDLPEQVQIRVRGRWRGIREMLTDRARKLICDVGKYRDGERFAFDHRWVAEQLGAEDMEVLSVRPSAIDIRLEAVATRKVPIDRVERTGEPAPGFSVVPRSLTHKPRFVEVTGPASVVRGIKSVRAAPIDISGADSDLRVRTRLQGVAGRHIKLSVEEVEVQVKLREQQLTKTLEPRPVVVRGCPEGMRCVLQPTEASVTIRGLTRAVRALVDNPPDNLVFADVGPAIERKERRVALRAHPVKGLTLTVKPTVAKFQLLGEIPAN
jgi:YbbR domain-containing protein